MTTLGVIFPPDQPPERLLDVASAAESAGVEQLWLWEDCFKESGIATAAAALARTRRLTVGIGLLPVPLRNVALTAMELATLQRLFPGRVIAGVGHGVLDWMAQVGARAASPMTLLTEYTRALSALLDGERVTVSGRYVNLSDVALDWPPTPPPPLLVGGVKPRTVALAGELADGVIFTGDTDPTALTAGVTTFNDARQQAGRADRPADIVVFCAVDHRAGTEDIAEKINALVAAGATTVPLHFTGSRDVDLPHLISKLATEIRPLVTHSDH